MYQRDTEKIRKMIKITGIVILLVLWILVCIELIIPNYELIIEEKDIEITRLEEKVYWLENINSKILILDQLLTPQIMAELDALNEVIKQTATGGNQKKDIE